MRTLFGMILGCLLTVAVAYVHDTVATTNTTSGTGSSVAQRGQLVNWDVASGEWRRVTNGIHTAWIRFTANVG